MKIYLNLFSIILFINNLQAQFIYPQLIDSIKVETYKSILLSSPLIDSSNKYLIGIQTINTKIDIQTGYLSFIKNIEKQKDSISVKKLRLILPDSYYIYEESEEDKFKDFEAISIAKSNFHNNEKKSSYNYSYIRIYEPLTKWTNLFLYFHSIENGMPYEIIPILYVNIRNDIEVNRKYYLYKVVYSKEGKIESVKVVN